MARQNLQRAIDPSLVAPGGWSGLDLYSLSDLGYEAVLAVVAALPLLSGQRGLSVQELLRRRAAALAGEAPELGWPSWNLAHQQAIEALTASGYLVPAR